MYLAELRTPLQHWQGVVMDSQHISLPCSTKIEGSLKMVPFFSFKDLPPSLKSSFPFQGCGIMSCYGFLDKPPAPGMSLHPASQFCFEGTRGTVLECGLLPSGLCFSEALAIVVCMQNMLCAAQLP